VPADQADDIIANKQVSTRRGLRMGWYFLQILIVFGLLFANIHFQWTDNPWIGFCLSWASAYIVTWLLSRLLDLLALLSGRVPYRRQSHRHAARFLARREGFRQAHEQLLRTRVCDDGRERLQIASGLPPRPKIVGNTRPLLGRK
jgi:hypothetical protein